MAEIPCMPWVVYEVANCMAIKEHLLSFVTSGKQVYDACKHLGKTKRQNRESLSLFSFSSRPNHENEAKFSLNLSSLASV